MGFITKRMTFFFTLLMMAAMPLCATDLVVYTENYPPFNYPDANGDAAGLSTDKVRQVLDATGLSYTIHIVPWQRAVQRTLREENALIYTITRIPSRESQFHWLVPLADSSFYLYAHAEDTRTYTLEAIKAGTYTASCVATDLTCDLLRWVGFPEKNIVSISTAGTGDFRLVIARRADIYLSEAKVNTYLRRQEGYSPYLTKPVLRVEKETKFYLASGKGFNNTLKIQIQKAYEALVAQGEYTKVTSWEDQGQ